MSFLSDLKVAFRSLSRARALWFTVAITLALGIGFNAAIFSVVRGVLLRPLANRDENSLIYIRQSAPGIGADNTTFSVPEIEDIRAGTKSFTALGTFSTANFTVIGLGEPREIRAGVVDGAYFEVIGLRAVIGRLLTASDDGPNAAGAAVLTHRFWTTTMNSDPGVIGKTIRLGTRSATIVGVLEPSVPYPAETELIANIVTSPHHLSATMVTGREHRMTEVFGRIAPGVSLDSALGELRTLHAGMMAAHSEAYAPGSRFGIQAMRLHDQITSGARTILLVLLAASGLLFVIACSNVANLILARTVRRESELALRAALGATTAALRRSLLAESLLLCGTGGLVGIAIAKPITTILARYISRYSVTALDFTLDYSLLAIAFALTVVAAVFLAFVPRLPSSDTSKGFGISSARVTGGSTRRLRAFAVTQVAASFLLLAGAGMLLKTLMTLQGVLPAFETAHVLAVNVPVMAYGRTPEQIRGFYREVQRRVSAVPGVEKVAVGDTVPWRDVIRGFSFTFSAEGLPQGNPQNDPRARFRSVSPGYFGALGVPIVAGRDFNEADRKSTEPVVIISQSIAGRLFPGREALNRHLMWTDGVMKFIDVSTGPRRIIGIAADIDDQNIIPEPSMTVYHPFEQEMFFGRLFVRAQNDPYALMPAITRTIHEVAADQPVERPSTLEDIRTETLAPDRLNAIVFGGFAALALAISIVGVAGVLAFSVSGRTREFGIRLAIGAQPRAILTGVLVEGTVIAGIGVVAGGVVGLALSRALGTYISDIQLPGVLPLTGAAVVLVVATIAASALPAARAARVDAMQALRAD
jgi:putative ABC transport system permease protein